MEKNNLVTMNYLCFVDGLLEYASTDPSSFAHSDIDVVNANGEDDCFYNEIANLNDMGYTFNDLSKMIEQQL